MSYYEPMRDVQDKCVVLTMQNVKANPHFHRCIEMLFIEEGSVTVTLGSLSRVFKKGEIAFIRLYSVHSADGQNSLSDTLMLPERYFSDASSACNLSFFALDDVEFNKKLFSIKQEIKDNYLSCPFFMLKGLTNTLLGYIAQRYTPIENCMKEIKLIESILQYIDKNFACELSLDKTADYFGFSKYHFSKLFHKYFNCNFIVYVNRVRARYVSANMQKGKSMTELILEAGFGNVSTYYQFVKREQKTGL